jgi:DNA repair protein RadC
MAELGPQGHRNRMKQLYLNSPTDAISDHNLLEILLYYAIPRMDVKPIAYDLMNYFGSLENVLNADVKELQKVKGIGENTAILISLVRSINDKMLANKNNEIKMLDNSHIMKKYFENLLQYKSDEHIIVVSLDNDLKIINTNVICKGSSNFATIDPKVLVQCVLKDDASSVVIAHNHPTGSVEPSMADVEFTASVLSVFRQINIRLIDHIIVGRKETKSMRSMLKYANMFD